MFYGKRGPVFSSVEEPSSQQKAPPPNQNPPPPVVNVEDVSTEQILSVNSTDANFQLLPLQNEYDPSTPNNYSEILKRKKCEQELQKSKMIQQELIRYREEQLKEISAAPPHLDISGEEAYNRRRQLGATPAASVVKTVVIEKSESAEEKALSEKKSFAQKLLEKMGWKEGEGLGREKQGIVAPLVARKIDTRSGVIVEGGKKPLKTAVQTKVNESLKEKPTRILMLTNIVGHGEVDEDLEVETTEEAAKFGNLLGIQIVEIDSLPDDSCVRIFLEYEFAEEAIKAYNNFDSRMFDGRMVKAKFFSEELYKNNALTSVD